MRLLAPLLVAAVLAGCSSGVGGTAEAVAAGGARAAGDCRPVACPWGG